VFRLPHSAPLSSDAGAREGITTDSSDSTTLWIGSYFITLAISNARRAERGFLLQFFPFKSNDSESLWRTLFGMNSSRRWSVQNSPAHQSSTSGLLNLPYASVLNARVPAGFLDNFEGRSKITGFVTVTSNKRDVFLRKEDPCIMVAELVGGPINELLLLLQLRKQSLPSVLETSYEQEDEDWGEQAQRYW
jgi:hypothetical protein